MVYWGKRGYIDEGRRKKDVFAISYDGAARFALYNCCAAVSGVLGCQVFPEGRKGRMEAGGGVPGFCTVSVLRGGGDGPAKPAIPDV